MQSELSTPGIDGAYLGKREAGSRIFPASRLDCHRFSAMAKPVAVITGASRGIGRATALKLSADFEIAAVARSSDELESRGTEITRGGGKCRPSISGANVP